jgi:CubicO group peptidase (beta-lactamase class C family)
MDELDKRIRERLRIDGVPGLSVALVGPEGVRWVRAFGRAELATGRAATPETVYLWFSLTKIVTATAVMRLAEQGAVDLDAPVAQYFPAFAAVQQPVPVTVRHLLSHSSGLANPLPIRWVHPAGVPSVPSRPFVERLLARHDRLRFRPGQRSAYSNLGFLVLGEVIAAVTGGSYQAAVRTLVLEPAGMRHTGFSYEECGDRPAATGYQRLPNVLTPVLRAFLPSGITGRRFGPYLAYQPFYVDGAAYGGLVGGAYDVGRLAALHLGGGAVDGVQVLSPEATAQMQRITPRGGRYDFGLGWFRPRGRRGFVEHLGGGSGFFTVLRLYPDQGLGIVLMGNTTRYDHESIIDVVCSGAGRLTDG